MSLDDSEAFILNIVKNPQVFFPVYKAIALNELKTRDEIIESTLLSESLVKESLDFLSSLYLIEKKNDVYYITQNSEPLEINFKLEVINQFAIKKRDDNSWAKQAAFYLIYKYILMDEISVLDVSNRVFIEKLERWFDEIGYNPKSPKGNPIKMNREKLNNWIKLANYLGLVYEIQVNKYIKFIDPDVFYHMIKIYCEDNENNICVIDDFIKWSNEYYLPFDQDVMKSSYEISKPYSDVIKDLCINRLIELDIMGNYPQYKFMDDKSEYNLLNTFNIFRVDI